MVQRLLTFTNSILKRLFTRALFNSSLVCCVLSGKYPCVASSSLAARCRVPFGFGPGRFRSSRQDAAPNRAASEQAHSPIRSAETVSLRRPVRSRLSGRHLPRHKLTAGRSRRRLISQRLSLRTSSRLISRRRRRAINRPISRARSHRRQPRLQYAGMQARYQPASAPAQDDTGSVRAPSQPAPQAPVPRQAPQGNHRTGMGWRHGHHGRPGRHHRRVWPSATACRRPRSPRQQFPPNAPLKPGQRLVIPLNYAASPPLHRLPRPRLTPPAAPATRASATPPVIARAGQPRKVRCMSSRPARR